MKKIFYIILDGLGGLPNEALGNKTPLEAAVTTYLDMLAQKGKTGLIYPFDKGIIPDSDLANFYFLGYDTEKYLISRAALECRAKGFELFDGDLALMAGFACIDEDSKTIKEQFSDTGLGIDEATALGREINSKITLTSATFEFKNTERAGGLLLIKGMHFRLLARISGTRQCRGKHVLSAQAKKGNEYLLSESVPLSGFEDNPDAREASALVNEFMVKANKILTDSHVNKKRILENKPLVNALVLYDVGSKMPVLPQISGLYKFNCGYFSRTPVEKAIASMIGMDAVDFPPLSGYPEVDYSVLAKTAVEYFSRYECLYLHLKDIDIAGYGGDIMKKIKVIEELDVFFFSKLLNQFDTKDIIFAVTGGYSTPYNNQAHCFYPMPLFVSGGNIPSDGFQSFSEKSAKLGSLGELRGQEVLPLLVKLAGK